MKSKLLLVLALFFLFSFLLPAQDWSYEKGTKLVNQHGVSGNGMPGGRYGGISWKDASGFLYLFGGQGWGLNGPLGDLNDLWKYNISANTWTNLKGASGAGQTGTYGTIGVSAPANTPGARVGSATWQDSNGNLWLFGGSLYNDLWKYNTTTNEWTWIKGSNVTNQNGVYGTIGVASASNNPGGRMDMVWWKDNNGNFWLLGGYGFAETGTGNGLNDLWKYDPLTNEWTWMNGSKLANQSGVYGTINVSSPSNMPGARTNGVGWTDVNNNLWLFGGANRNDLWKYNIVTNEWTWMNGSNLTNQQGSYGAPNSPSNVPGGRVGAAGLVDNSGNLLLFGGYGYASTATGGYLSDLWQYNPSTNLWNFIKGSSVINTPGVYGTIGVAAPSNMPGGRNGPTVWKDATGKLWLFGGVGFSETGQGQGQLADLWKIDGSFVGINEYTLNSSFKLFPNPSNGSFEIQVDNQIENGIIKIYNSLGQEVYKQTIIQGLNYINDFSRGIYHYVILKDNLQLLSGKVVIE
jgi:N-acetylneuraminic acid mutarotase